nr:MAG TPA: transmembrane protein [Caudoviricetes sp.]
MKRIDIITAIIAFGLIVLIFGAIGGVDNERLNLGQGLVAVFGLTVLLVADIRISDALKKRERKRIRARERLNEMKKGA